MNKPGHRVNYLQTGYLIILIAFFIHQSNCQAEIDYNMELRNGIFVDHRTYEFEVYIKANAKEFILNAYQCSFIYNRAIINNGILSFEFIEGTSELVNKPEFGVGTAGTFWMPALNFASFAGKEIIEDNFKRVGKFRIQNSNSFGGKFPGLKWNFGSLNSTIICGDNFRNITNPIFHTYSDIGFPLYMNKGWNYFSIPFQMQNMAVKNIFPTAASNTFLSTNDGYKIVDTLIVGKAYWIQFNQESVFEIKGEKVSIPIPLNKGWNSIGISHYTVSISTITTNPSIIITAVFGINNSQYYPSNVLEPGKGYQVYSEQEGYIILDPINPNYYSLQ